MFVVPRRGESGCRMNAQQRWVKRYSWHMKSIPQLLQLSRDAVTPGIQAARYDRVIVSGSHDVMRLPFEAGALDTADELWALLVLYSREVAYLIGGSSPAALRSRVWSTSEPQGLPANIDGMQAWVLAEEVVQWLVQRALTVLEFAQLEDTEEHLFARVRKYRKQLQLEDQPAAELCYFCGQRAVRQDYAKRDGRERCMSCGTEPEEVTDAAHLLAGGSEGRTIRGDDQAMAPARDADEFRR